MSETNYTSRLNYALNKSKTGYIFVDGSRCWNENVVLQPTFNDGLSLTEIGEDVFRDKANQIKSVEIPDTVKIIGKQAFYRCSLTRITIPGSVTEIGEDAFCKTISSFNVAAGNKKFKSIDGNLYSYDGTVLICYANGKTETSFSIPDGVKIIEKNAFSSEVLEEIIMPDTVTNIKASAFSGCKKLKRINLSKNLTEIGVRAFASCPLIKEVTIPEKVTEISEEAFSHCMSLSSVTLGKNIEVIGTKAFRYSAIETVTIPISVKKIGHHAFGGCEYLKTVYCERKKPFGGVPFGWDKYWLCNNSEESIQCKAEIVWNYKG